MAIPGKDLGSVWELCKDFELSEAVERALDTEE